MIGGHLRIAVVINNNGYSSDGDCQRDQNGYKRRTSGGKFDGRPRDGRDTRTRRGADQAVPRRRQQFRDRRHLHLRRQGERGKPGQRRR